MGPRSRSPWTLPTRFDESCRAADIFSCFFFQRGETHYFGSKECEIRGPPATPSFILCNRPASLPSALMTSLSHQIHSTGINIVPCAVQNNLNSTVGKFVKIDLSSSEMSTAPQHLFRPPSRSFLSLMLAVCALAIEYNWPSEK